MTKEEIEKRGYKKFPQNIIEIVDDDSSITREDCNCNLRNAYMQGLIDNNISFSTDVGEAVDKYLDNRANYLEYSDDGWEDKTDIDYVERAFKAGAEWMAKQGVSLADETMLIKATEWLSANLHRYDESIGLGVEEFVERFKKAMKR